MNAQDRLLILRALSDAIDWQKSIADAHKYSLLPCCRSPQNDAVARNAEKDAMRYKKLREKIQKGA